MKKTLKRELKLFEIVESDAFVVSVCSKSLISFFVVVVCWDGRETLPPTKLTPADKVKSRIAGWRQLRKFYNKGKKQKVRGFFPPLFNFFLNVVAVSLIAGVYSLVFSVAVVHG